ncbi:transcriptional initiation protein Tat [Limnochorda pilosa]|uniref:Transcriptional initiation protein Tat n=1 Tax=Limnochorda pilosa TaxID=1555112 RepID=A0A0K2SJC4_LIMPI|nr:transcriptional initiation protein Tat [Limnochorda pilosa]
MHREPAVGEVVTWDRLFSRRRFLKAGVTSAAALALGMRYGLPGLAGDTATAAAGPLGTAAVGTEREVYTLCEMCVWRCGVKARVRDGRVVKLEGNPDHPNSRGRLCPRGNAGLQVLYDPDRLRFPMIRAGERGSGLWRRVSWEEALDYTAEQMQRIKERYGPEAMIVSSTHNLSQPYFENLLKAYGTPNYGTQRSLCFNAMTMAFLFTYGIAQPPADLRNARYAIFTGRNLAEAISNSETQDFVEMVNRGAKVVVLDPRFTKSAAMASEWLPVRPGTDLAFFLALLQVMISEGLYDRAFVEKHTVGLDELARAVAGYTPEWAEGWCEVPAATIRRIAREFAAAAPHAVAHPGWRTSNFVNSFQTERAIAVLNALAGNWNVPGGLLPEDGEEGGPELGTLAQPPYPAVRAPRLDGVPWKHPLVPLKYGSYQEIRDAVLSGQPYQAHGWLVSRQNPILSISERAKTLRAFEKLDFIGVIDVIPNDTAYFADVILPESTYLERYDPLTTAGGKVFIRQPVVEPLHDTRSALWIFKELGRRLGLADYFPYEDEEDLLCTQLAPYPVSLQELKARGSYQPPEGERPDPFHFHTTSGKIELASSLLARVGEPPVPTWQEPPRPPQGHSYLLTGKVAQHSQMGTQNNRWLTEIADDNPLWLHPSAARRLGVKTGDLVKVESGAGRVLVRCQVTEGIRPDCVYLTPGFGHISAALRNAFRRGVSDSALHVSITDPVTGSQALSETFVSVSRPTAEDLRQAEEASRPASLAQAAAATVTAAATPAGGTALAGPGRGTQGGNARG